MTQRTIRHNKRRVNPVSKRNWHAVWQAKQSVVLGVGGLLLVSGMAASAVESLNRAFTVEHWVVDGAPAMQKQVDDALQSLESLDFWHSRPARLHGYLLQQLPDLAEVNIRRQLPDALQLHVVLRQAVALWKNEQDELYLVDEKGVAYRPRRAGERVDLPILRMSKEHIEKACVLLSAMRQVSPRWFHASSEMFAEPEGWRLNLTKGQQWLLPFGQKAVHNVALLGEIVEEKHWQTKRWRVNTRLGRRWMFRPVTHEGVV